MHRIALALLTVFSVAALDACGDGDGGANAPMQRIRRDAACPRGSECGGEPPPSPHLNYYGGPIVSNAKVVQVIYGSGVYQPGILSGFPSMGTFYQQVLASPYIDWLSEYNTPTQTIGRGQYVGQRQITPDPSRNGAVITDVQIQTEISAQITAGHLPPPDANTIYMVDFPKGKTETYLSGSNTATSCADFCAYHSTFVRNGQYVYYGVLPDLTDGVCATGCGSTGTVFDHQTMVASHELVEAITDPAVGLAVDAAPPVAWVAPVFNGFEEISDLCVAQPAPLYGTDGHRYTVQKNWSNFENQCEPGPIAPARGSWYPPARSGNGFFMGVIPSGGLFFTWFTYTPSGVPTWYLTQLAAKGDFFSGDLYGYHWANGHATGTRVGSVSLVTTSTTTGRFIWRIDSDPMGNSGSGVWNIQYLAVGSGSSTGVTGSWYAPTQAGWGQSFDQQGSVFIADLSLYTATGQPTWVYGSGGVSGSTANASLLYVTGTNLCPSCTGTASTSSVAIGSMSLSGITANGASFNLALTNPAGTPNLTQWNRSALPIARLTN